MARKSESSGSDTGERKLTTLYARDGREYQTASPSEIIRLKSQGYSENPPPAEQAEEAARVEAQAVAGPPPPPIVEE
jgi:hypothetical protein